MPLLERVKLCAIVSRNLDEFFAVRVAGLRGQVGVQGLAPDGRRPHARPDADRRPRPRARAEGGADALWLDELRPALADEGIRIVTVEECAPRELRALTKRFNREIEPLLTPIAVGRHRRRSRTCPRWR